MMPPQYWISLGRWGNCSSEGDGLKNAKGLKEDQIETKWKMNVSAWDLATACKMPDVDMEILKDIPGVEGIEEEHPRLCKALAFGMTSSLQLALTTHMGLTTSSKFSGKVMGPLMSIGPVNVAFGPNWDKWLASVQEGAPTQAGRDQQAMISELVWSKNTERRGCPMQADCNQRVGLE
ncbi:hypothetical protein BS47DRAFT_1360845 [Hydnum rufescens UP504]|uniref:Uncharacterized protein n=1 Tax=Hydnum rufescens UP504 TaxID=1448309 RepID=A0A9P6DYA8_9AGAM|nr:hypothetical protein BS47DRAFT_1360845 [Hydnum rufescens UP504]